MLTLLLPPLKTLMMHRNPLPLGEGDAARCSALVKLLMGLVMLYRLMISPWLGPKCRFVPSCSEYAMEALQIHGPLRGCWLTLQRLAKCHPWGGHGLDPVPLKCQESKCQERAHDNSLP